MCVLRCRGAVQPTLAMAKQLHFNKNGEALKKMQAGVDKLASVVGVTLGPKVRPKPQAREPAALRCGDVCHAALPGTSCAWPSARRT